MTVSQSLASTSKALELPREILDAVTTNIQAALPEAWGYKVFANLKSASTIAVAEVQLQMKDSVEPALTFVAEVCKTMNRPEMLTALAEARVSNEGFGRMLAARYISEPVREELKSLNVSYADATGNLFLSNSNPSFLISAQGANRDPWRSAGRPKSNLAGATTSAFVRALVDSMVPVRISQLIAEAGVSRGIAYRTLDYLESQGFLTREDGNVLTFDWKPALEQWAATLPMLKSTVIKKYINPFGAESTFRSLAALNQENYVVSGTKAAESLCRSADLYTGIIYTPNAKELASRLGLVETERGANVLLIESLSFAPFANTRTIDGLNLASAAQVYADLYAGPGRNPEESKNLLDWMERNEDVWRRKRHD